MSFRTGAAVLLMSVLMTTVAVAQAPEPETDEQKTLYALGLAMSRSLAGAGLTEADLVQVQAGLADGILGRDAKVDLASWGPKIDALMQERMAAASALRKEEGSAFLERMATETGAMKTESGMVYIETTPGTGASPGPADTVEIHYHGTLEDGTVFDSSVDRGTPATFGLNGVIPCFGEGVGMMKIGGKAKLVCPPDLAYGDRGSPPTIPPGATLVFEVELLSIAGTDEPDS